MNHCAFASERCSGRPQWHHVISKNRLKRMFPYGAVHKYPTVRLDQAWLPASRYRIDGRSLSDILGDPRNRVWLCDTHHQKVTNARLYVDIPESVWRFAEEFGLAGQLENDIARRAA